MLQRHALTVSVYMFFLDEVVAAVVEVVALLATLLLIDFLVVGIVAVVGCLAESIALADAATMGVVLVGEAVAVVVVSIVDALFTYQVSVNVSVLAPRELLLLSRDSVDVAFNDLAWLRHPGQRGVELRSDGGDSGRAVARQNLLNQDAVDVVVKGSGFDHVAVDLGLLLNEEVAAR